MAPCMQSTAAVHAPLIQIRSGYRTTWGDVSLSVESGAEGWNARVQHHGRTVYKAQRSSAAAAKSAAVEFALLLGASGTMCRESPERLARQLRWSEYW